MPNAICYAIKMDRALYVSSFPFLLLLFLLLFSTLITKKKKMSLKIAILWRKNVHRNIDSDY